MNKNGEGYVDPTPGAAFGNIRREEHKREADRLSVISNLIPIMKNTAELAGFEVVGRIVLKDKHTGKEYRGDFRNLDDTCVCWENIEEKDRCNGCFGAANNDCHICPKNGLEV